MPVSYYQILLSVQSALSYFILSSQKNIGSEGGKKMKNGQIWEKLLIKILFSLKCVMILYDDYRGRSAVAAYPYTGGEWHLPGTEPCRGSGMPACRVVGLLSLY